MCSMSHWLTCPLGHSWQAETAAAPSPAASGDTCPTCGMAGQTLPVDEVRPNTLSEHSNPAANVEEGAKTLSPTSPQRGPALPHHFAGYEILGELGHGGMGVVYKAVDVKLQRLVAIKVLLAGAHASEEGRARFWTEARSVALLHHPNIVPIFSVDEHDGLA